MNHRLRSGGLLAGVVVIAFGLSCSQATFRPDAYPRAAREETTFVMHGETVADPYHWLEEESSPASVAFIEEQNAFTRAALKRFDDERQGVARELEALYGVESMSNVHPYQARYFFARRDGLQNHAVITVCEGDYRADTRVVIDPNTFSRDGTVALDWWYPSPDGSLIAYGKSAGGTEKSTLYIRNVEAGTDLEDEIPFTQYCSVAWDADGKGFHYNRCPDPATVPPGEENFHMRVYHHRVGEHWQSDRYVWGEGRPFDEEPQPYASSDRKYLLMGLSSDPAKNDLFFRPMGSNEPLMPIAEGIDANVSADILDNRLFIHTNHGAPRYRICTTTVSQPGPEHWTDLIPEQAGVIDGFAIVDGKLVVRITENVHSRLLVYGLDGGRIDEVSLPASGTVSSISGEHNQRELFFAFSSWVVPSAVYRYDLRNRELKLIHQMPCPVDLSEFETEQVWFKSTDGARVPMYVVHRADIQHDGNNPALLYAYGGFNIGMYPGYRPGILPFVKRGGVWALANIRGGGEFGQEWHRNGRRENKQQCFDDFYAAAEKLIELQYTRPEKLACMGGSNGGLLIGVAVTQRPDLFRAALSQVPLMDMLRFHKFGMGAQWVHEYGNPDDPEEFKWVRGYSPYHNVKDGVKYPATLIVTAEGDNRVDVAHACKMTAALQHATDGPHPILLRVERKAGHGAGKPLAMRIENQSEDWVFLMWQLGMIQ